MKSILVILLLFSAPVIFAQDLWNGTYENESTVFVNKKDSTQNFSDATKYNIRISIDKNEKGTFLIQNQVYQNEYVVFTINEILGAVEKDGVKAAIFDVSSAMRAQPVATKIVLYQNEKKEYGLMIDALEYSQTFKNLQEYKE